MSPTVAAAAVAVARLQSSRLSTAIESDFAFYNFFRNILELFIVLWSKMFFEVYLKL